MAAKSAAVELARPESFAIKGVLMPLTLLELKSNDVEAIRDELHAKVEESPAFFSGSAIIISFEKLDECDDSLLSASADVCSTLGLRVVGVKGGQAGLAEFATAFRIAHFPSGKVRQMPVENQAGLPLPEAKSLTKAKPLEKEVKVEPITVKGLAPVKTKIVHAPVRSGQQVYSEGDLIVMAPVSAGAELLAVGNIHVYGPLRGRALAGVQGDEAARIFCISQEAELVSIAGHFMIDEMLKTSCWKTSAHVSFDGNELKVEMLELAL